MQRKLRRRGGDHVHRAVCAQSVQKLRWWTQEVGVCVSGGREGVRKRNAEVENGMPCVSLMQLRPYACARIFDGRVCRFLPPFFFVVFLFLFCSFSLL